MGYSVFCGGMDDRSMFSLYKMVKRESEVVLLLNKDGVSAEKNTNRKFIDVVNTYGLYTY